jgi:general secretion pathway protein A
MYTEYWRLDSKPFESGADPEFYYPSETHQGALLKLRYAVENRRGGALLAGASGLGKTLVIESLKRLMPETVGPVVHIVFPKMSTSQLLGHIAHSLGTVPTSDVSIDASVRQIENHLQEIADQGKHAVLVIDEAHLLDETDGMECIRLLLNYQRAGDPLTTVILCGQTPLLPIIDRLPALEERLGVKCLLRPLTLEETSNYVGHRLSAAGAQRSMFEGSALDSLFAITGGVPRQINRLCDLALLIGFADQLPSITAAQVEAVNDELVTVAAD